jgi:hypothetical protein
MGSGAGIMCQTKNVMDIQTGVVDDNYVVYTLPSLHCTPENWLPTINNRQEVTNHYLRSLGPILYAAREESFGNVRYLRNFTRLWSTCRGSGSNKSPPFSDFNHSAFLY